jgi:hypothetical protein
VAAGAACRWAASSCGMARPYSGAGEIHPSQTYSLGDVPVQSRPACPPSRGVRPASASQTEPCPGVLGSSAWIRAAASAVPCPSSAAYARATEGVRRCAATQWSSTTCPRLEARGRASTASYSRKCGLALSVAWGLSISRESIRRSGAKRHPRSSAVQRTSSPSGARVGVTGRRLWNARLVVRLQSAGCGVRAAS